MTDQYEPPTKKRRIEAPVKEEPEEIPILFNIQSKEEETQLAQISQLLRQIRNVTRRNEALAKLLKELVEETHKLKARLEYLKMSSHLTATISQFQLYWHPGMISFPLGFYFLMDVDSGDLLGTPSQETTGNVKGPPNKRANRRL